MRIEPDIKLDFKDVLIRPKRSKLISRSTVDLNRTFIFKYSRREWTGIPVMTANMDTAGTIAMAEALMKYHVITALHKHYSTEQFVEFYNKHTILS